MSTISCRRLGLVLLVGTMSLAAVGQVQAQTFYRFAPNPVAVAQARQMAAAQMLALQQHQLAALRLQALRAQQARFSVPRPSTVPLATVRDTSLLRAGIRPSALNLIKQSEQFMGSTHNLINYLQRQNLTNSLQSSNDSAIKANRDWLKMKTDDFTKAISW